MAYGSLRVTAMALSAWLAGNAANEILSVGKYLASMCRDEIK